MLSEVRRGRIERTGEGFKELESWPTGEAGGTFGCTADTLVALWEREAPWAPGRSRELPIALAGMLGLRLLVRVKSRRRPTTKYVR